MIPRDVDVADRAPSDTLGASIFAAPWDALDDATLLAHYRGTLEGGRRVAPRRVHYEPVVDPDETRPEKIEALMGGHFEFNGESHQLADPIEWLANPSADVEWHILLHKFYYAVGLGIAWQRSGDGRYARRWTQLLDGWMRVTPPGFIAADVTGRRVQNWIYSLHYFLTKDECSPIPPGFFRRLLDSIHTQVEFLCANLTPKRNHRTLELHAIFLAGVVFPEMRRAADWRAFALEQTVANVAADLMSDGVHCELSTDYHHLALRNWLQVRQLAANNGIEVPATLDAALQRALEFSLHVHKPDGSVPSLSDGDARGFPELLRLGALLYGREDMRYVATRGAEGTPPARRVAHFADSGYSVVRSGWGQGAADFGDAQHLVFDCGPLGEGNHGHFDCLSFELAAFGRSLIVDPGRYTYSEAGDINWRVHFRGTAAHNTVCVDGRNQTRYAPKPIKEPSRHAHGSVRHKISGPAPAARLVERFSDARLDLLHGHCASSEYDAVHERCIVFVDQHYWIVSDWLRAGTTHEYALKFQLGEAAQDRTSLALDAGLQLRSPGLVIAQPARPGVRHELLPGWVSARYGFKQAAPALRCTLVDRDADFDSVLMPWRDQEPRLRVDDLPAYADNGVVASALRIELIIAGEPVTDHWFHARGTPARSWRIGDFEFSGRWVHWRIGGDGRVKHVLSHAGAAWCDHRPQDERGVLLDNGVAT